MNTDDGTFMQFQNDESRKKMEKLLGRALLPVEGMPDKNCTLCAGAGAVQSKITMKWIPCVCTNVLKAHTERLNALAEEIKKQREKP